MKLFKISFLLITCIFFAGNDVFAQIPQGYYDSADQKNQHELKTAMYNIIKVHERLDYYTSATYFKSTDWHPGGYFWDMYSDNKRTSFSGMNREHCLPKSWWSASPANTVAYSDLFNLYPSDMEANEAKNNYPLGEVGTTIYNNGVVKVGYGTYPNGYSGLSFEPADEYKGDFARTYFYVVTCYQDYATNWRSLSTSMMKKEIYPVFQTWAINMLLQWHRNDPVSEKEIKRNAEVFKVQKNRNPFIDYPDLAEYIWGSKKDQLFTVYDGDPELIEPEYGSTLDFGEVMLNQSSVKYLKLRGQYLRGNMTIRLYENADNYFSIPTNSVSASLINSEDGYDLKITYTPRIEANNKITLALSDGGILGSHIVNVLGTGVKDLNGIGDIAIDGNEPNVYANGRFIYFENIPEDSRIEIYSVSGQLIKDFRLVGNELYFDESGIYLLKVNGKIFKIVM